MVLVEQLHTTTGLRGKLEAVGQGYYCVGVNFDALASRIGVTAARLQALAYGDLLRKQLSHAAGCVLGNMDNASRRGRSRRRVDMERTFLAFLITSADESWRDTDMTERFRSALLRADQKWRQAQAGKDAAGNGGKFRFRTAERCTIIGGEGEPHG